MRIAFVLTYPIYHDFWTTEQWLGIENQNRWIPGILAQMGHEVEYWAVDRTPSVHPSALPGFGAYTIRIFAADEAGPRTKFHYSDALVAHARATRPDLVLLKGVDGGIGSRLVDRYLRPERRPFVFLTGGKYYDRRLPQADLVVYETEFQKQKLVHPGLRFFWRRAIPPEKLIWMPKSVNTDHFRPIPGVEKAYDVMAVGRLVRKQKSYDELGALAEEMRVAVVGGGADEAQLRQQYPKVHWLGQVPNRELPRYLNRARLFLHPGARDPYPKRDFFPRVIAEAAACGLPCIGFSDITMPDVIPDGCGLRVGRTGYAAEIRQLLADPERLARMGRQARHWAEQTLGMYSARPAMEMVLAHFDPATNG